MNTKAGKQLREQLKSCEMRKVTYISKYTSGQVIPGV